MVNIPPAARAFSTSVSLCVSRSTGPSRGSRRKLTNAEDKFRLRERKRQVAERKMLASLSKQHRSHSGQAHRALGQNQVEDFPFDSAPYANKTEAVSGLLTDISRTRRSGLPKGLELADLEKRIALLEGRIALEKSIPPSIDPGDWETLHKHSDYSKVDRTTKRAIWRQRRKVVVELEKLEQDMNKKQTTDRIAKYPSHVIAAVVRERVEKLKQNHEKETAELEATLLEFKLHHTELSKKWEQDQGRRKELKTRKEELESEMGKILKARELTKQKEPVSLQTGTFVSGAVNAREPARIRSEDLRSSLSEKTPVVINPSLTIDITAPIPELQSQIFQLHQLLKTSFPRIDALPYDVWTSNNVDVLQTWAKILTSRWATRFKDVDFEVDGLLGEVLDQSLRDHDLSNEAAKRMGKKFNEVFGSSSKVSKDTWAEADLEEFDAELGSWMRDEESGIQSITSVKDTAQSTQHPRHVPSPNELPRIPDLARKRFSTSARTYTTKAHPPLPPEPPRTATSSTLDITGDEVKPTTAMPEPNALPHLTPSGSAHMVSVSAKPPTLRTAIAVGTVHFSNAQPLTLIRANALKKGDVLSVSRIAGIMAAKATPTLIPLCHPIALSHVGVELRLLDPTAENEFGGVSVEAKVQCTGPTGVEMEALTAVMGAGLTVVDMCKAVDKGMRVESVRVVLKEGGRSGTWKEEDWVSASALE